MLEFIILGEIPGTTIQIGLTGVLMLGLMFSVAALIVEHWYSRRSKSSSERTKKVLPASIDLAL